MLEQQRSAKGFAAVKPPPAPSAGDPTAAAARGNGDAGAGGGSIVDQVLLRDLVEMVPLVESLMDRRANSRRAAVVYTPTPSQPRKVGDLKNGKGTPAKKRRDPGDVDKKTDSPSSSMAETILKEKEELEMLREQMDNLQSKLLEKDEELKSLESTISQMNVATDAAINELRQKVAEKEALINSTGAQLNSAKILLADKQASLEKMEWELQTSNGRVEDLQAELSTMEFEFSALMTLFERLIENDSADALSASILSSYDSIPVIYPNEIDRIEIGTIEEEKAAYSLALASLRENPTDEHSTAVAEARSRLQMLVM